MKKQMTPYQCHIFVCANVRENNPENPGCGAKGGSALKDLLKKAINARGWKGKVRVSTSGCLGLCGTGPNVLLHPQGIHFSAVTENDVPLIMDALHKLLPENRKIWFPAKTFGWGWGPPCSWQGWVVLLIYIALLASASWLMPLNESPALYTACVIGLTIVLIIICIWKGGRPRWHWGK
jgi:(2Fe-2S) ferredoxin